MRNANIKHRCDAGAAKASRSPSPEDVLECKDNSCISKEESCSDSRDSEDLNTDKAEEGAEECNKTKKSKRKFKQFENKARAAYPEPRLPFPCISTLSSKDQNTYLDFLMSKKTRDPPQVPSSLFNGILILPVPASLHSNNLVYFRI